MTTKRLARVLVLPLVLGATLALSAGAASACNGAGAVVGNQTLLAAAATYLGVTPADNRSTARSGASGGAGRGGSPAPVPHLRVTMSSCG